MKILDDRLTDIVGVLAPHFGLDAERIILQRDPSDSDEELVDINGFYDEVFHFQEPINLPLSGEQLVAFVGAQLYYFAAPDTADAAKRQYLNQKLSHAQQKRIGKDRLVLGRHVQHLYEEVATMMGAYACVEYCKQEGQPEPFPQNHPVFKVRAVTDVVPAGLQPVRYLDIANHFYGRGPGTTIERFARLNLSSVKKAMESTGWAFQNVPYQTL
jgi:hypothetical protein